MKQLMADGLQCIGLDVGIDVDRAVGLAGNEAIDGVFACGVVDPDHFLAIGGRDDLGQLLLQSGLLALRQDVVVGVEALRLVLLIHLEQGLQVPFGHLAFPDGGLLYFAGLVAQGFGLGFDLSLLACGLGLVEFFLSLLDHFGLLGCLFGLGFGLDPNSVVVKR